MEYNDLIYLLAQFAKNTKDVITKMQLLLVISDLEKNGITHESAGDNE